MRKLLTLLSLATALALPVAITQTGCTTTQEQVAYKTLASVAWSVDAAMKGYASEVVAGRVSDETQARVREAHGRYQRAFALALTAAQLDFQATSPADVAALATDLLTILAPLRTI